jgi:hypothetical protein
MFTWEVYVMLGKSTIVCIGHTSSDFGLPVLTMRAFSLAMDGAAPDDDKDGCFSTDRRLFEEVAIHKREEGDADHAA